MKKVIISIMVIVALFAMTGCSLLDVHEHTTTTTLSGGEVIVREYVDGELVNRYTRDIDAAQDADLIMALLDR